MKGGECFLTQGQSTCKGPGVGWAGGVGRAVWLEPRAAGGCPAKQALGAGTGSCALCEASQEGTETSLVRSGRAEQGAWADRGRPAAGPRGKTLRRGPWHLQQVGVTAEGVQRPRGWAREEAVQAT